MKNSLLILLILIFFTFSTSQNAKAANCKGEMFNPITSVCWSCIFPLSIGSMQIGLNNNRYDTKNPSSPICICQKGTIPVPGIAVGFWEPIRMADVTKRPFCMVNMGGMEIIPEGVGKIGVGKDEDGHATWHMHWYINPIIYLLNLFLDGLCLESSGFDLSYLTEFDPLFHDDMLSFVINPEAIVFANPIAHAACIADCVSSTIRKPLDPLFWCAGCQGSLYPFTGNLAGRTNSIQGTSMTIEKSIAKFHRQLILPVTSGPEALCQPIPAPIVKKSQYRLQTTFPVVGKGNLGCNAFGKSTFLHAAFKELPVKGEDFGYLIWRKRNCCLL